MNTFIVQYSNSLSGTYVKEKGKIKDMPTGSKVRLILEDLYHDYGNNNVCNLYSDDDIKKAIMLHEGDSIPGFPSIDAFLALLIP